MITYLCRGIHPLALEELFENRPIYKDLYVYDVLLSDGALLRASKGGIGQTPERYIPELFSFAQQQNAMGILHHVFARDFRGCLGRGTYLRVRSQFNAKTPRLSCAEDCAKLYLLIYASRFTQKYNKMGYTGECKIKFFDWEEIERNFEHLRSKFFSFRRAGINTPITELITPDTVIHARIPNSFNKYGCGFMWTPAMQRYLFKVFQSFVDCGHKVCLYKKELNDVHS